MSFREIQFVKSVVRPEDLPVPGLPEVAFLGRSNVGKSSLINAFLGRKKLARVSSTPGFTRALNIFRVDHRFLVVDLPGYGFAKVPPRVQQAWKRLIEGYLSAPRPLKLLVLIFDIRRQPDELDQRLIEYVNALERPFIAVLNKIDKLPRTKIISAKKSWQEALSLPEEKVFLTSCRTGAGVVNVRNIILEVLKNRGRK
ncbi:ribosome biogenesis GTP-binding protein YihA/YsxC [Thermosulfurimonas dismutans]|uniref:Probable GTP-binding protein EngB n=1 Tax=Thermosulfurimonas dismutans TaxID=999894 RepID=A0A179D2D6_9BACT|nr:ribosome biogenesis GTP-binding protein YihA/YsxC [Thermosulfurimonas dismutans]OAQ20220.1 GTP-binding protein EngB [Thermosulfurimonas dismutans]